MKYFNYILNLPVIAQTVSELMSNYGDEFQTPLVTICEDLGISKATAVRRLRWLLDNNYLVITKQSNRQGNRYKLRKARIKHFIEKVETLQNKKQTQITSSYECL
jgi:CTP-dependent riboflavin kinase